MKLRTCKTCKEKFIGGESDPKTLCKKCRQDRIKIRGNMKGKIFKRLYFTCPIKSLYMMKEFGVQFYIEVKQLISCNLSTGEVDKNEKTIQIDFEEEYLDQILDSFAQIKNLESKIYVAAESEHIFFKLQKEDLVNYKSRSGKNKITATYLESFLDCESILKWKLQSQGMNSPKIYKIDAREFLIIMRDNKQFFMPEVENER
jgi:hypothetical protein